MNPDDIWITGMGVVCAAGAGTAALRSTLLASHPALRQHPTLGREMGSVPEFRGPPQAHKLDRSARLFLTAAEEAWGDSGLANAHFDPDRVALIEGSSLGPLADILAEHRRTMNAPADPIRPSRVIRFMTGSGGALMAQRHAIRGPTLHLSAASVSALCAIGEACDKIRSGTMDIVIAGGSECPLDSEILASFEAAGILGPVEAGSCRPFDARRAGTVLGEGAGVLILESADHARRRGAPLRSRITGFGLTTENFSLTGPDPSGAGVVGAAEKALAGLSRPPGWIKTHGTGTVVNDAAECAGLARLFGSELETIPLTSLKSTLGHCLGASGAVEAVASVLCMEEGIVPATVGTTSPDRSLPPCRVATEVESVSEGSVLLLAESFGGRCAAMVLEPSAWGS